MDESITKCLISEVMFKTNKLQPIIVSFQNGELLPDETSNLKCGIYIDEHSGKKRTVAMKSKNNCLYKGSEPPHESHLCRTVIAIRNKKTNKVRLIEADSIQLFPQLLDLETEKATENTLDKKKLYSELSTSFGSTRKVRQSEVQHRMQFEVHAMTEQLSQTANVVKINKDELAFPSIADFHTIVPCNRQAHSVDQLYRLNDLVSPDELDSLQAEAEEILKDIKNCNKTQYSEFFCYYLNKLTSDNKLQQIKILLYAEYIIKYLRLPYNVARKKKVAICLSSEIVTTKLLDTFSVITSSGRTRPNSVQDLAICHVILLGLIVNGFKLDLEPLLQCITFRSRKRLVDLCETLGAQISQDKKSIILKIPLREPRNTVGRRKK